MADTLALEVRVTDDPVRILFNLESGPYALGVEFSALEWERLPVEAREARLLQFAQPFGIPDSLADVLAQFAEARTPTDVLALVAALAGVEMPRALLGREAQHDG